MYFPDLAKCISGEELILSWDDVLQALLSYDGHLPPRIVDFFSDGHVQTLLSNSFPAFAPASKASRAAFDSQTSSINITPSAAHQYSIDKIKENALCLSKEVDLDELEALRLTILEWQYRPEARLRSGFSDAELASLRDLFGSEYCENAGLIPASPLSRSEDAFDSEHGLRSRLLQLYFHARSRMLAVAKEILSLRLSQQLSPSPNDTGVDSLLSKLRPISKPFQEHVLEACQSIEANAQALQSQSAWGVEDHFQPQIDESSTTSHLQCIALVFDTLLLLSNPNHDSIPAQILLQYLRLLQNVDHFATFQSDIPLQNTLIEHIHTASACTSLLILQPTPVLLHLADDSDRGRGCYIYEQDSITEIHNIIIGFSTAACTPSCLAALAWGLLLVEIRNLATLMRETSENRAMQKVIGSNPHDNRRASTSSAGSGHQSIFEDILSEIPAAPNGNEAPEFLINTALHVMGVFEYASAIATMQRYESSALSSTILQLLQDLVKQALPILGYSSDLLSFQNTILGPSDTDNHRKFATGFIIDQYLMKALFDVAAARFPYEALPFLRLCKSLAHANIFNDETQYISFRLRQLDSFTQLATEGFASYHTIREDENANLVTLDHSVSIFDLQPNKYLTLGSNSSPLNIIPAETIGEVISESTPPTIKWQYTFSGYALLGKWIELHREGSLGSVISVFEEPDDVVAEVIWTLVALLQNTYNHIKPLRNQAEARRICDYLLEEMSVLVEGEIDLVGCIFELSEHQLQAARGQTPTVASRDLLTACVDFIILYAELYPSRAWPLIIRSSIFGMSSAKRNAMSFIGGVELPIQNFKLLESCSRLFETIVDVALKLSVQGTQTSQLKGGRLTASQRLNSSIISNCTEIMLSALEAMTGWAFQDLTQKQRIFSNITSGMYDIIYYAFGSGEKYDSPTITKTSFVPAATALVQALQNPGFQGTGAGPLLHQLIVTVIDSSAQNLLGNPKVDTSSSIDLLGILLQCSQTTGYPQSDFVNKMLSLLPVLVRIPADPSHPEKIGKFTRNVLKAIPPGSSSSILGHLGAASSISWVDKLRHTSSPSNPSGLLWQIYSQLVTLDQQWLAVVLVTGKPPGRQLKEGEQPKLQTQGKPCLELALNTVSKPSGLNSGTLIGLLEFLLEAQRNWPSVSDTIAEHSELFPGLVSWVCKRDIISHKDVDQAGHNKVAALVTELAVLHLHRLMALKDERVFAVFIPLLNWLADNAISIAAYNTSLHANLKKNFTMKYPALEPELFRRSGLIKASYGPGYFFDLGLADKIIGEDLFWKGTKESFSAEFERANINLSIVDSEICLLRSLEYLSIEHAAFFARNRDVAHIMARMVTNCLSSNSQQTPVDKLFDTVLQTRADLAITLLRRLVAVKPRGSDFPALLSSAWDAVRFRHGSYEAAIVSGDLYYWRTCLNIMLMCLQFHVEKKVRTPNGQSALVEIDPFNGMFCEIARDVVGEGLRAVSTALQANHQNKANDVSDVSVRDVSLLLSILQTILRLPSLGQFMVRLGEFFVSTGATQSCLTLYSWSHLLIEDGQHVFADLATRFLASLSSLTIVAEDLAVEGIFTRLQSAKFTQRLQAIPGGASHLDKRPTGPLMYSIWSQGMLPICLNLLHGVGGGVAGEVSAFLNQYPEQLNRATLSLSGAPDQTSAGGGILTLPLATELATLSLISHILRSFRDAGASAGIDPEAVSPLEAFDNETKKRRLAEDIRDAINQDEKDRRRRTIALNEREVKLERERASGGLDGKIVEQLKQAMMCLGVDLADDEKV